MVAKRRWRVATTLMNRTREFAQEAEAWEYARGLFRHDARLAQVAVTEIAETVVTMHRDEAPTLAGRVAPAPTPGLEERVRSLVLVPGAAEPR